jgi:carbamoyltransferase
MANILGINAFHGDSSAALLKNGAFCAGIEEERLNRTKHWAGFPGRSIETVLAIGGIGIEDLAHVAVSRDPKAHLFKKALFAFGRRPSLEAVRSRLENHRRVADLGDLLASRVAGGSGFRGMVHNVEHHRAHLASAFYCAPFEEAACLTVDGFGDFLSSMSGIGRGNGIEVLDEVAFPHSLGIFYTAVTQFLGFPKYGDEYKVMGLASYGRPCFLTQMREIVSLREDGRFETNLDYFRHASEGVTMSWEDGEPVLGPVWSARFENAFGPARLPDAEICERDHDIAASLQAMYEEAFFHRLRWLHQRTGLRALCLAGGCAMNSVANGKIFANSQFKEVFIQSAAGDAGTALGAAQYVWHQTLGQPRSFTMDHSYWGPEFSESDLVQALETACPGFDPKAGREIQRHHALEIRRHPDQAVLTQETARAIAAGEIVGWFQGRTEWGPRALGNRSILADPRRPEMKDVLNSRIKRREPFRPFAPSILEERVGDYFEESYPDPFMIKVYPVRASKRAVIPAVTHVDGTGRLQTVSSTQNANYWRLLKAFEEETGVPVLLNTSFNENEPIVNTPAEAIACFLRTRMDRLVIGPWDIRRRQSGAHQGGEAR